MYFYIRRSLAARPEPDNTFWTASTKPALLRDNTALPSNNGEVKSRGCTLKISGDDWGRGNTLSYFGEPVPQWEGFSLLSSEKFDFTPLKFYQENLSVFWEACSSREISSENVQNVTWMINIP